MGFCALEVVWGIVSKGEDLDVELLGCYLELETLPDHLLC